MAGPPDLDLGSEIERPDACALDLKKYFLVLGILAALILVGAFWYTQFYTKDPGVASGVSVNDPAAGTKSAVNWFPPRFGGGNSAGRAMGMAPADQPMGMARPDFLLAKSSFSDVVRALRDSVVNITATRVARGPLAPAKASDPTKGNGIMFSNPFSGRTFENVGSGVIVSGDGYIVTNFHIVGGTSAVFVNVFEGRVTERYRATIAKLDETLDLALLKIEPKRPLSPATLGNSDALRVADNVIAIGSPFGLDQTVSRGIVSAMRKSLVIDGVNHSDLIQTDAAINQGNSGGPLIAGNGTVIGINTAIYTPTGAFAGIGFAIPSNKVRRFAETRLISIAANTAAGPGRNMGVGYAGPTIVAGSIPPSAHKDGRNRMDCMSCHKITGAARVNPGANPVAMEGLRFAGPPSGLAMNIAGPGAAAAAEGAPVLVAGTPSPHRDGRQNTDCLGCHTVVATANANPVAFGTQLGNAFSGLPMNIAARTAAAKPKPGQVGIGEVTLGAALLRIDRALSERLNHPQGKGVFVSMVNPHSLAEAAGLKAGDIILKVDGQRMRGPKQLAAILADRENGETARIGVLRGDQRMNLTMIVAGLANMPGLAPATGAPAATRPPTTGAAAGAVAKPPRRVPNEFNWKGLEIENFTQVAAKGAKGGKPRMGAEINEVTRNSPADKAGIRVNDVLLEINGRPVGNPRLMDKAIRKTGGQANYFLKLIRDRQEFFTILP